MPVIANGAERKPGERRALWALWLLLLPLVILCSVAGLACFQTVGLHSGRYLIAVGGNRGVLRPMAEHGLNRQPFSGGGTFTIVSFDLPGKRVVIIHTLPGARGNFGVYVGPL